jgi:hypothetical protein
MFSQNRSMTSGVHRPAHFLITFVAAGTATPLCPRLFRCFEAGADALGCPRVNGESVAPSAFTDET